MSVNYELIRDLKEWAKGFVRERIAAGLVKYGAYTRSTASGEHDKISGYQTEGSDETPYDFEGRRVFPFGLRSRPPSGTWGVWVGRGGESGDGVIVGAESSRFGPNDLKDGEVAFYNKVTGTLIKLDENGAISITAAGGQLLTLNGSTYSLPQWDDFATALDAFIDALAGITGVATLTQCATALNNIGSAAATLKGLMSAHGDYKSTKTKNG